MQAPPSNRLLTPNFTGGFFSGIIFTLYVGTYLYVLEITEVIELGHLFLKASPSIMDGRIYDVKC